MFKAVQMKLLKNCLLIFLHLTSLMKNMREGREYSGGRGAEGKVVELHVLNARAQGTEQVTEVSVCVRA